MTYGYPTRPNDAIKLTHWAIDNGINFFDTADIYQGYDRTLNSGGGVAEEILGKALKGKRNEVIITTKVGNPIGGKYKGEGLNKKHILNQIDSSLTRLKTDVIDIYEMHVFDENTSIEESISVFTDLIKIGKVRHWGFSNFPNSIIAQVIKICTDNNWPKPIVSQPKISWLNREALGEHNEICQQNNIKLTPYRILEGGLLTGKYKQGHPPPAGSRLSEKPIWVEQQSDKTFESIAKFEKAAKFNSLSPVQYAAKWVLENYNIASIIIGAKNTRQIEPLIHI